MNLEWLLSPFYYKRVHEFTDGTRSVVVFLFGLTIYHVDKDKDNCIGKLIVTKISLYEYSVLTTDMMDLDQPVLETTSPILKRIVGERTIQDEGLLYTQHLVTVNKTIYVITTYVRHHVFSKWRWLKWTSDLAMFKITCVSHPEFNELGLFRPVRFSDGHKYSDLELVGAAREIIQMLKRSKVTNPSSPMQLN